jgi:Phage tail sheath protein subtilisin-like domain/Phage tail sheath C-terminal domain
MSEMILPGVYIEERPEGLISAGQITVGNIGMVGTARKGKPGVVHQLGSYADAVAAFGTYDAYDPFAGTPPLTLVRGLELAFSNGAARVYAVRVAGASAVAAARVLQADDSTNAVTLTAPSPGSWGNDIEVNVWDAPGAAVVRNESRAGNGTAVVQLSRTVVANDPRTRVRVLKGGLLKAFTVKYDPTPPAAGTAVIDTSGGSVTFFAGEEPTAADTVTVTYVVPAAQSRLVTLRSGPVTEQFTVADVAHLESQLENADTPSQLATATVFAGQGAKLPKKSAAEDEFNKLGADGNTAGTDDPAASAEDYEDGLDALANENVHIVVAAGMSADLIADKLLAHVQNASTDLNRRERIAVVGSKAVAGVQSVAEPSVTSGRVIYVAPGVRAGDAVAKKAVELPGAYAAAAVAGMLSARAPHVSLTNKQVAGVSGVFPKPSPGDLSALIEKRVLALEERGGIRVVKAITTDDPGGPFRQITTRRIVDYARFGVRSAASPFIGLLNNDRVRKAMKGAISGFLAGMVDDEMLVGYELDVTATREEEIRGIARVTMTVKPTFSIDYIKVTMFLG